MGTGAGMRGSRLRGNDGRLSKSEQLPSVDAACALQGANVLDYLGHLRLGDGRYRRHVAEEPVMLRDALPHGALEGGVSVVARPVDGAYERRAFCRSLLRLRRGSPRSSQRTAARLPPPEMGGSTGSATRGPPKREAPRPACPLSGIVRSYTASSRSAYHRRLTTQGSHSRPGGTPARDCRGDRGARRGRG